jgi:hypothetical protein
MTQQKYNPATHQWTRTEVEHPSGERVYVAVRDDGKKVRIVADRAVLKVGEVNNFATPEGGLRGLTVLEWSQQTWHEDDGAGSKEESR